MAKSKSTKTKSIVKQPKITPSDSKVRKQQKYKTFKLSKRIKHQDKPLPSWWALLKKAVALLVANKKQITIFILIYGLLYLVFVRGLNSPVETDGLQETLNELVGEETAALATGFTNFNNLISSFAQSSSEVAQAYQTTLFIIGSLALIWLFRQQQAGNKVSIKMAFYRGMYPLIPFILVLIVVFLQLLPVIIGNFLLSTVISSELAVGALEKTLWFIFFGLTFLLSFYMIASSSIALYIVTLPEMTPMKALKQARELVRFRRFSIIRKGVAIILFCIFAVVVVVLPLIFLSPFVAEWTFFLMTVVALPFIHAYMFSLYRELL